MNLQPLIDTIQREIDQETKNIMACRDSGLDVEKMVGHNNGLSVALSEVLKFRDSLTVVPEPQPAPLLKPAQTFDEWLTERFGKHDQDDITVAGLVITGLPFRVPWKMGGAWASITITDIRRGSDGALDFQLADNEGVPFKDGEVWVKKNSFPTPPPVEQTL